MISGADKQAQPSQILPNALENLNTIVFMFKGPFSIDWILNLSGMKATLILRYLNNAIRQGTVEELESGIYRVVDGSAKQLYLETLDIRLRQELHLRIVDTLKKEPQGDPMLLEEIAFHLMQTGETFEAAQWMVQAGDRYNLKADFPKAAASYQQTLDMLKDCRDFEFDLLFFSTLIKYQNIFIIKRESKWLSEILAEAYQRAQQNGQLAVQSLITLYQSITLWHRGRFSDSKELYEQAWSTFEGVDDAETAKIMVTTSAHYLMWHGRFRETVELYEKHVQNVETYPKGLFPLYSSTTVAFSYAAIGKANTGLGMLEAIYTHAVKTGRNMIAINALIFIAYVLTLIGQFSKAVTTLQKIDAQCLDASPFLALETNQAFAFAYLCLNDVKRSAAHLRKTLQGTKVTFQTRVPSYSSLIITSAIHQGHFPPIRGISLEQEIELAIAGENILLKGMAYGFRSVLMKEQGELPEKIIECMNLSLEFLEKSGHEMEIARQRIEMARFFLSIQKTKEASAYLEQVKKQAAKYPLLVVPDELQFLLEKGPSGSDALADILKLGQDMVTIRDNKELLTYMITRINATTGAERGAVFLLKPGSPGREFILRAAKNLSHDDVNQPEFQNSLKIIHEVATSGKATMRKVDAAGKAEVVPFEPVRSCICVPMMIKHKTVGVLYHDNRFLISVFKESDLDILTYFAALAAIAIENADAYDEIKRLNKQLSEEKEYYREQQLEQMNIGNFVGKSKAIRDVVKKIHKVADTDTTVLIQGETGVGKELVAATILDNSSRRDKPFICVNCSDFSETLIASELFGHEKGSFTGATERRIGRFELADGGTLFLDEIGDIPMPVQIRLLRVLQTKQFERVGGIMSIRSDFRLLAATNQNLLKLVSEGKFRKDLYYRLNVFPIHVPPLRKRKEDIPLLAAYFLQISSQKTGKRFNRISEETTKLLQAYHWPGNVREVENVIERSVVMSTAPNLQIPELNSIGQPFFEGDEILTMAEMEKRYIIQALEKTNWKIRGPGGAAELLDMHYSTLRSRIKKHGISRQYATVY